VGMAAQAMMVPAYPPGEHGDALDPLRRTSLHERVAARVLSHIVQNDLAEGDRIPSERELARRLAVSRSSVRQAIAGLVSAGVLSPRHGGGTFVAQLDLESAPLASVARRRTLLPSVHEARRILEVPAAALAAERRDDADLDAIERAIALMASEVAMGEVGARGDAAFHAAVTAAAHNPALRELMERIEDDVAETRSESLSQVGRPPRSLDDHRRIADAIAAGDPEAAAEAMRRHLDRVADVRLLTGGPR
jgi:GntR family transcriptional repressor for pyruvate dehydrogenase complex